MMEGCGKKSSHLNEDDEDMSRESFISAVISHLEIRGNNSNKMFRQPVHRPILSPPPRLIHMTPTPKPPHRPQGGIPRPTAKLHFLAKRCESRAPPGQAQPGARLCPAAIHPVGVVGLRWGSAGPLGPAERQPIPEPLQPCRGNEGLERPPRSGQNSAAAVGIAHPLPPPETGDPGLLACAWGLDV